MKKIGIYNLVALYFSFFSFGLLYSSPSYAEALRFEEVYTLNKGTISLRVRSGPSIKYSKIGVFTNKDTATISSSKMNGDTRWVKIKYAVAEDEGKEGEEGWVSYKHLLFNESATLSFAGGGGGIYKVKTQNKKGKLNIRKGAGSNFKKLSTLANGTSGIRIKGIKKIQDLWWVKISHSGKEVGWVNSQYLDYHDVFSYVVLYGDTLQSIARKHDVSWFDLAKLNKIFPPYTISAGKVIEIPFPGC